MPGRAAPEGTAPPPSTPHYAQWLERTRPTAADLARMRETVPTLAYQPAISVLMPVFDPEEEWVGALLEHARRREVGAVGGVAVDADGRIAQAGLVLDAASIAAPALVGLQADSPLYFGLGRVVRNVSAVTGECMMIRRSVLEEAGGFDRRLGSPAAEFDLCLRLRRAGFLVVCTPHARVRVGASGLPALTPRERRVLGRRLRAVLARGDPYFHPNLLPDFSEVRFRL